MQAASAAQGAMQRVINTLGLSRCAACVTHHLTAAVVAIQRVFLLAGAAPQKSPLAQQLAEITSFGPSRLPWKRGMTMSSRIKDGVGSSMISQGSGMYVTTGCIWEGRSQERYEGEVYYESG